MKSRATILALLAFVTLLGAMALPGTVASQCMTEDGNYAGDAKSLTVGQGNNEPFQAALFPLHDWVWSSEFVNFPLAFSVNGRDAYPLVHLYSMPERRINDALVLTPTKDVVLCNDGLHGFFTPQFTGTSSGQHSAQTVVAEETGMITPAYGTQNNTAKDYVDFVGNIYYPFEKYTSFKNVASKKFGQSVEL